MSEAVRQAVLAQYAAHKSWSIQLHHDNLVALAETRCTPHRAPPNSRIRWRQPPQGAEVFAVADDADFGDAALAGLSHGGDCARLGADAFRIGGVLHISARIDRAASPAATPIAKPDSPAGP